MHDITEYTATHYQCDHGRIYHLAKYRHQTLSVALLSLSLTAIGTVAEAGDEREDGSPKHSKLTTSPDPQLAAQITHAPQTTPIRQDTQDQHIYRNLNADHMDFVSLERTLFPQRARPASLTPDERAMNRRGGLETATRLVHV